MDPPYLSLITARQPAFMAKQELFGGAIGMFVRRLGGFPVRRGEPDRAALRTAIDLLAQGYIVAIFPEGTRSPDGRIYPAERGFGLIARQSGAPIVPVAIEGTERILPKGSKTFHRHPVTITIGKPFTMAAALEGLSVARRDTLDTIGRITMERIRSLMVEPPPVADKPADE
jgi:1-acyl-sn-glycerol-3-phosphate acyltransferase